MTKQLFGLKGAHNNYGIHICEDRVKFIKFILLLWKQYSKKTFSVVQIFLFFFLSPPTSKCQGVKSGIIFPIMG